MCGASVVVCVHLLITPTLYAKGAVVRLWGGLPHCSILPVFTRKRYIEPLHILLFYAMSNIILITHDTDALPYHKLPKAASFERVVHRQHLAENAEFTSENAE